MRRLLIASLFVVVCAALVTRPRVGQSSIRAPLSAEDRRSPFVLELPEAGDQAITAPQAQIPAATLTRLTLRVLRPYADSIDYGKIHTAINGEAADIIFDRTSDSRGYVLRGDLTRWPRFKLRPGKNVIEVSALDKNKTGFYASYVLLTAGTDSAAATAARATVESVPVVTGADRQPPVVWLSQPKGAVQVAGAAARVAVSGIASDDSGVVASVEVNGQPARLTPAAGARGLAVVGAEKSEAAKPGAVSFSAATALNSSSSSIVVAARDRTGNLTRVTLPVKRREPAVSAAFKGRKFALVVGVSRYKHHDGGLYDLAYADTDARALRDFLLSREGGGFAAPNVLLLENEQATVEAVRGALNSFLPGAGPDDLILIFIAGHGGPDPYAPTELYFMLHDTKTADMRQTALPMGELQRAIEKRVRAGRLVVFVDTCHSAG